MLRLLLLILFNMLSTFGLSAQTIQIRPMTLSHTDGLESGYNNYIKTDSKGNTWISSVNGVFRYDTTGIEAYLQIGENIQSSFYEDRETNLWCSSYSKLLKYNRQRDSFESFQIYENPDSIIDVEYRVFHLEKDSIIWLRAGNHLYRFNRHTKLASKVVASKGINFAVKADKQGRVNKIYTCSWHNAPAFEIIHLPKKAAAYKTKLFEKEGIEFINLLIQNDSLIWLFTTKGLYAYNPSQNNALEKIIFPNHNNRYILDGTFVDSVLMIFPIADEGLWLFDTQRRKIIQQIKTDDIGQKERHLKNISAVYFDKENHLWLSHKNKAQVSIAWFNQFSFSLPFHNQKNKLIPSIRSILEDRQERTWCNTPSGEIYLFNESEQIDQYIYTGSKGQVSMDEIRKLSKDAKGNIWGLGVNKLYRYHQYSSSWEEIYADSSRRFFFLVHISDEHKLLSTISGIIELKKNNDQWHIVKQANSAKPKIFTDGLQLYKGKSQKIYISNKSKELKVFENKQGDLKLIERLDLKSLVYCIAEDSLLNRTWLGATTGLFYFDWEDRNIKEGPEILQNILIAGLIKDDESRLWVATDEGLYCINADKVYHYREEDGLPSSAFSLYSAHYSSNGKIWLGTDKGLVVFHPDSIQPYPVVPKIVFKDFRVNNEPFESNKDINQVNQLEFAHHQHTLSFNIQAVNYYLPHLNVIKYRLKNYDDIWHDIQQKGAVRFNQLKPGAYTFEVYGINANGVEGAVRGISITIFPPWWTTWWAISLFVLAFVSGLYLFYLYLLNRKLKEQKRLIQQQKELQEERNRIAGELHDDLGAGLSIIRFLSTPKVQKKQVDVDQKRINKIYQSAGELMEKMSDIIWAMNTENDSLENLVDYIEQYIYDYLAYNNLSCEITLPDTFDNIILTGKQRRNILLAVKESLHNIVKHADASKVIFSIQIDHEVLLIRILDNGKGMDQTTSSRHGNGLKNIRKRMQEIGGHVDFQNDNGMKVLLSIPLNTK